MWHFHKIINKPPNTPISENHHLV